MRQVHVGVLGAVSLTLDREPVRLAPKVQLLLAALVASGRDGLDDDQLLEILYAGNPPSTASSALRVHLSKLRDALEPERQRAVSSRVARVNGRWRAQLEATESDLGLFESTLAEARTQEAASTRAGLLMEALDLWHGPPYAQFTGSPFDEERTRLQALRFSAARDLIALQLSLGMPAPALELVDRLLPDHPYDEELVVLRSRGVYQVQGTEPALVVLRSFRALLAEELGLDPTPAISDLEGAILRHDQSLHVPASRHPVARASRLIGRDDLLSTIRHDIGEHRTVCLLGEAGIGKSALLRDLALGANTVLALGAGPAAYSLVHSLMEALGVPESPARQRLRRVASHQSSDGDPHALALMAEDLCREHLPREVLVLVDDAETVDPQSVEVLSQRVRHGAHMVLARRPGGLQQDPWAPLQPRVISVPPLTWPHARQLAARINPNRPLDEQQLRDAGGVPLLIEYVARSELGPGSLGERILSQLSPSAVSLAKVLAVIRTPVPAADAAALRGDEALEELLVSRVAVDHAGFVALAHPLTQHAIEAATGPRACTQVVTKLMDGAFPALLLESAVRAYRPDAGDDRERQWALRAARLALSGGDFHRAESLFLLAASGAGAQLKADATHGLARTLMANGHVSEGRAHLIGVMHLQQSLGRDDQLVEALAEYVGMLAPQSADAMVVEGATNWLLGRGRLGLDQLVVVRDLAAAASAPERMEALTAALLDDCARAGTPAATLVALAARWRQSLHQGRPAQERLPISQAGVELARQLGDPGAQVQMLRHRVDDLMACMQLPSAQEAVAELRDVAERSYHAHGRWWVDLLGVETLLREGDPSGAAEEALRAHARWPRLPLETRDDVLQVQLFVAMYLLGQVDELQAALATVARGPLAHEVHDGLLTAARLVVDVTCGSVDRDQVLATIDHLLDLRPGWRRSSELYLGGLAAVEIGAAPARLVDELLPFADTWVLLGTSVATLGPVAGVLADLTAISGRTDRSRVFLEQAVVGSNAMNARWWRPDRPHDHLEDA